MLLESPSEFLHFALLPDQVLILAQDITNRVLSRKRLHNHLSGDPPYTTTALQPSVSAATTGAQGTFHVTALDPSAVQTPSVHSCVVQCCRARLHVVTLCFLLMSFDDSTRGVVVFTFSLLLPPQVLSVHCKLGSNCEPFFDSCSVGIDSACSGGTVLSLST